MKKVYHCILCALILAGMTASSQTTIWEENFNTAPPGWSLEGNWEFIPGEMEMYFYPVVLDYDFSAISPPVFIPPNVGDLTISQFLEVYEPSVSTEQCEIAILSDDMDSVVWGYHLSTGNWGGLGGEDLVIPMASFAGTNVRIKFRTWGPTTDAWYGWYVYALSLSASFNNDLSALSVMGPNNVMLNQQADWTLIVKNSGLSPQSGYTVRLFNIKTGDEIGSCLITDVLDPGEIKPVSFSWTPDEIQNTALFGTVTEEGDEYEVNNTSSSHFVRVEPDMVYNILVWDNDNDIETIMDPETGIMEQADAGITKALDDAGIDYTYTNTLPDDPSGWDIIFATMGCYCLS